MDLENNPCN